MQPIILCVHMDASRVLRLSMAALSLGIRVTEVKPAQWGQPLAALCGLETPVSRPAPASVGEEILVMAFFPDELPDRFLPVLRSSLQPPVRLKAVLTAHNRAWTCGQLYLHLSREAASFPPP